MLPKMVYKFIELENSANFVTYFTYLVLYVTQMVETNDDFRNSAKNIYAVFTYCKPLWCMKF